MAILFRLSTQETKLARLEQGYATALDAAKGGSDLFMFMVQNGSYQAAPPALPFGATFNNVNCLQVKMSNPTSVWSAQPGWAGCPTQADAINPNLTGPTDSSRDITLSLSSYTVNLKVIDNSPTAPTGATPCFHGCYYYTVISRAQAPAGNSEHADILFVYRYDAP